MAKPNLRTVKLGERSDLPPKSITEAADTGTTRELMVAMRARVAKAVEDPNTPARDLSSLSKRLVEIVRDIEAIDARAQQEVSRRGDGTARKPFDASAI